MRRLLPILLLAATFTSGAGAAAPEPPRNLSAAVDGNTVTLTWQAPSSGSPPLGYLVEASLSPGGASIAAFLVLDTSLVRTAVPNGVYYLRVRGGNAEGISAASNQVVVSVPGGGVPCPSPPEAPTNLSATVSNNLVTLTWNPPAGGCAPTTYVVQAGSAASLSDLAVFTAGGTTLAVSAPPGAYFVRVVAFNAFGGSLASNELTVLVGDLTGVWSGTSDYINAPFQFNLVQNGRLVSGTYQDQHDMGSGGGELTGNHIRLDVNFGDTGIRYEGTIETDNRIRGTLLVPRLGRTFTFEMTR
ncbi:MAG TPA: fibronectin type III domain-containing protein [Vicinamibacterales bacterium]|nr:fibronectin type III domain-containing protein [Vicinamibacterales bacterium]